MTNRAETFDRSVMRSSEMPSLKYSCSASPLMLANGITAIDGLSGRVGGEAGSPPFARPMRKTRTGRAMFLTGFSPRSSSTMPSLSRTELRTARETKIAPGSASASSRAAILTPSP